MYIEVGSKHKFLILYKGYVEVCIVQAPSCPVRSLSMKEIAFFSHPVKDLITFTFYFKESIFGPRSVKQRYFSTVQNNNYFVKSSGM